MTIRAVGMAAIAPVVASAGIASAAVVTVAEGPTGWQAYMNVFKLPSDGGDYLFGSGWGVADLNASFDNAAHTLTMSPNTIGDPDPYWYQGGGAPGNPGNRIMEANLYRQVDDGSLSGTTVTFQGLILSNSFTAAHQAKVFIRDFAADYSSFVESSATVTAGAFSINLNTVADASRHVQYGFQVKGVNVWFTDTAPFGNMVIQTIPTPGALAVLGLTALTAGRRRR